MLFANRIVFVFSISIIIQIFKYYLNLFSLVLGVFSFAFYKRGCKTIQELSDKLQDANNLSIHYWQNDKNAFIAHF